MNITNLLFYLAIEKDQVIENMVKSLVLRPEGLQLLVPMVYYNKFPLAIAASHNLIVRYNRANGIKLKKIYWAPYNPTESGNTAYDHSNIAGAKIL